MTWKVCWQAGEFSNGLAISRILMTLGEGVLGTMTTTTRCRGNKMPRKTVTPCYGSILVQKFIKMLKRINSGHFWR